MPADTVTVLQRTIAYHEDASGLFAHLGGTEGEASALLESADISTHSGISSLAVLTAAARLTCAGETVTTESCGPGGTARLQSLAARLAAVGVESVPLADAAPASRPDDRPPLRLAFRFPAATMADERARLKATSSVEPLRLLQQAGGMLVGGFAFDYLATFETLPAVGEGPNTFPDYQFLLAETLLEINHREHTAVLYAHAPADDPAETARLERLLDQLAARAAAFGADGSTPAAPAGAGGATAPEPAPGAPAAASAAGEADAASASTDTAGTGDRQAGRLVARATMSDAQFRAGVDRLKGNIRAGDVYQVVPARAFTADCPDAFAAYRALRAQNPSPYMFYLRGTGNSGPFELFGASPESNLKYTAGDRTVQLYPIAGTRPRGATDELDIRNELTLRTDAKELAEHTMLVDLARNDVARVSTPGTRRVAGLMDVDRYSAVMHLVSRVTGTLAAGLDALDAYRACMNMGTLTGAPKLRASELLREFEGTRRGSYGGAVGYLRAGGDMDTCIVIRSAFVADGVATVQAGAGVVRDSDPQAEADETLHKAWAVLRALATAQNATLEVER